MWLYSYTKQPMYIAIRTYVTMLTLTGGSQIGGGILHFSGSDAGCTKGWWDLYIKS